MMSESKMRDLLHGSEYVVTFEDKDSDWILVGDVPWEYASINVTCFMTCASIYYTFFCDSKTRLEKNEI